MVWSLVKPPAAAGPLSRIGDYLLAARGPGLYELHAPKPKAIMAEEAYDLAP